MTATRFLIFDNQSYVSQGESVSDHLSQYLGPRGQVSLLAVDGAAIALELKQQETEMAEATEKVELRLDHHLRAGTALKADALDRKLFAERVVEVLERVTPDAGLVASVEGAWGCGKTSLLAMVEELLSLQAKETRPVVVHFNPWLIGDRDALLRQFLASMVKAVKLTAHAKEGKRVAKELKTYSKVFDTLKFVPGAEPWVSIVKSVVESVGNASEAVFEHKTPDVEAHKDELARALRKFPSRIVVLIDDIDRLYPAEVYEMVRIVKAVGDLPNIGYLLAWDEKYVSAALDKLSVPYAAAYLDKVVQVRLSVPPLSFPQRVEQMNKGLDRLPPEARGTYFPNGDDRHASVFHHGLRELVEHPRDVVRLFDVVSAIERDLRGEIHLADLIGFAALMTKAAPVFELLRRTPQAFVGRIPGLRSEHRKPEEVVKEHAEERNAVIAKCANPKAVRELLQWLFPKTAKADDEFTFDRVVFTEGHLAHPDRLLIALQLSTRQGDVSLVQVRHFLFQPSQRKAIAAGLDEQSCTPFVSYLGAVVEALEPDVELDSEALAVALAQLVDSPPFVIRVRRRQDVWLAPAERVAENAIEEIASRMEAKAAEALVERIIGDEVGLSVAADFALDSYAMVERAPGEGKWPKASKDSQSQTLEKFVQNVEQAASSGELFEKVDPGGILRVTALLMPARCKAVYRAVQQNDPSLDKFAEAFLRRGFDSNKGQNYAMPDEPKQLKRFVAIDELKCHAAERLKDASLTYPIRAAWRALVEGRAIYGKDGSLADR